ncbi:universal stress protein [Pontibacter sp. KCTC 32443]|uniref:universal stress protein n=1 Tax=Pontibacter TaxID=323449 RepID=UPI00164DA8CD|nr:MULTISPECIES: universal stress protein [Pontibacter]MBC5772496.1 universal stress protein [Pontibacter sp. KCTC 32443]
MKKILCPTDFSKTAAKALDYAIYIARKSGAHLSLLHVVHLPIVDTSETALVASELLGEQIRDAGERLKAMVMQIEEMHGANRSGEFTCDYIIKEALLTDLAEHLTKNEGYGLIVMGTTGGGNALEELLIGSNTEAVVEEVRTPLLAVPAHAKAPDFTRIVYATDYIPEDLTALHEVVEFANIFGACIDLVHVSKTPSSESKERADSFWNEVMQKFPSATMCMKEVVNKHLDEGLKTYFEEENASVLAILRRDRGFFAEMFSQRLADRMTYKAEVPLLILHERK